MVELVELVELVGRHKHLVALGRIAQDPVLQDPVLQDPVLVRETLSCCTGLGGICNGNFVVQRCVQRRV